MISPNPLPQRNVFMVEDSATIRQSVQSALEDLTDLRVVAWADAQQEAVAWLSQNHESCGLVILDLFLKRGSGVGVLEWLRENHPALRAVVLSNYITPEIRSRCERLGARAVFDKSSELDAFIAHCRAL